MNYPDGQEIMSGDLVAVSPMSRGVVLCDFEARRCVEGFDWQPWAASLTSGVLVDADREGLIHFQTVDPDLALLKRDHRLSKGFGNEPGMK
jgi:hypothetical protein